MQSRGRVRVALAFVNYGAYHQARARALSQVEDLQVDFIELASAEAKYPWHASAERSGLEVLTLAPMGYEHASKLALGRRLWQVLDKLRPQVVVACGYSEVPMLFAIMWAKLHARPLVLMFETSAAERERPFWEELPKRAFLASFVNAFFCGGVSHRAYLRRLGVPDARIWEKYDVVDVDYFQQAAKRVRIDQTNQRATFGLPEDYFLYVGRLSREKNLPRLLEAYRHYRDVAQWGFVLVGQGPQEQELREHASRLGLNDLVWAGAQPLDRLPAYYTLARALVLPSLAEPWGLVVNEAMACSLPVLLSERCGCAPDLVRSGTTGYLFDPMRIDDMSRQLMAFSSMDAHSRDRMARAASALISAYTPEAWAENLAASIRTAASGARIGA